MCGSSYGFTTCSSLTLKLLTFLLDPQTKHVPSSLRAFAYAVPPAWNIIPLYSLSASCHPSPWKLLFILWLSSGSRKTFLISTNGHVPQLCYTVPFLHCTYSSFHLFMYVFDSFCFSHKIVSSRKVRTIILSFYSLSWIVPGTEKRLNSSKFCWKNKNPVVVVFYSTCFISPPAKQVFAWM